MSAPPETSTAWPGPTAGFGLVLGSKARPQRPNIASKVIPCVFMVPHVSQELFTANYCWVARVSQLDSSGAPVSIEMRFASNRSPVQIHQAWGNSENGQMCHLTVPAAPDDKPVALCICDSSIWCVNHRTAASVPLDRWVRGTGRRYFYLGDFIPRLFRRDLWSHACFRGLALAPSER